MDLMEMKEEIMLVEKKLLKILDGRGELKMSFRSTPVDVFFCV